MPAANDRGFVAGAGPARLVARLAQIDPRHRASSWALEPSLGQCARSRRAENIVATDTEAESGTAKAARSAGFRRGPCRGSRVGCKFFSGAGDTPATTTAKRNPRNAGFGGEVSESGGLRSAVGAQGRRDFSRL